ncbi:MAG TPA: hypothetical protein PLE92_04070 [Lentisphaeria bacterium]|nr:hypothetical protein [Lentisphaeria bacterium]HQC52284.1 hypothetical protein [Lentisphaeria bacterium]HQL88083.1 hypothetical protein [Lentisphaeria bacterium]
MSKETKKVQNPGGGRAQRGGRRHSGAASGAKKRGPAMTTAAKLVWADAKDGEAAAKQLLKSAASAVPELAANLNASNDEATVQASFALEAMTMAASTPGQEPRRSSLASALAKALDGAADDVARNVLIRALQLVGGDKEVPALAKCLEHEGSFDAALLALRQIGSEEACLAIANSLASAKGRRRTVQAAALADFGYSCCHPDIPDLVAGVLAKASPADAPMLWAALAKLGYAGVAPALGKALKGESKSRAAVARGCLSLLARNCLTEDDVAAAIAELFKAERESVPSMMALMDNTGEEDGSSVPYLLGMASSEDKVVQEAAANLLIEDFAGSSVTETIMLFYQQHNDGKGKHDGSELKQVLIRVLGRRGDVAARPFLMSLLHDPEAAIRKSAMEAIENLMGQLDRRVLVAAIL